MKSTTTLSFEDVKTLGDLRRICAQLSGADDSSSVTLREAKRLAPLDYQVQGVEVQVEDIG